MSTTSIVRRTLAGALAGALGACTDPAAPSSGESSFTADVTGALSVALRGSAAMRGAEDWARQLEFRVTAPNGERLTGVFLSANGDDHAISIGRAGTTLASGTYRIGRVDAGRPLPAGAFTGAYVRRSPGRLQVFAADSGTVTFDVGAERVRGTFTLYASAYDVVELPSGPPAAGVTTLRVLERGRAPITMTGAFDATRTREP